MDRLRLHTPPRRVVSLVPSITESLFDLGFGGSVVGVTDFCIHPAENLAQLPRVGGPKDARAGEIAALLPEIVFANQEENTPEIVQALEAQGVTVRVFFPRTVREAVADLWEMAALYQSEEGGLRVHTIEMALDWITAMTQDQAPVRYFCPIWQEETTGGRWWMTFNADTYSADLLRILRGENIFAQRSRRYPLEADLGLAPEQQSGGRDTRYPRVTLQEIIDGCPEVILLPTEPYPFTERDLDLYADWFQGTPAAEQGRIFLIDGSLITWPGTRLAKALTELPSIFDI